MSTLVTDRPPAPTAEATPPMWLEIEVGADDYVVATARGTVSRETVLEFARRVGSLLGTGAGWITVDLSHADLPDASAAAAVDRLRAIAARNDIELHAIGSGSSGH